MTYMDMLSQNDKPLRPSNVERIATISSREDARRLAAAIKRTDEDSYEFRSFRALMHNTNGVCG
jgi:hypothetical protein